MRRSRCFAGSNGRTVAGRGATAVFEPFFTTKGAADTGLGLPSSFALVRQAGGAIAVASAERQGTSFQVLLPRVLDRV